jgi:hypothetical protein
MPFFSSGREVRRAPASAGARVPALQVNGDMEDSRATLIKLIEASLSRGHRKVAARRIMMLLYRYQSAPEGYVDLLTEILNGCPEREVAGIRRSGIQWAQMVR